MLLRTGGQEVRASYRTKVLEGVQIQRLLSGMFASTELERRSVYQTTALQVLSGQMCADDYSRGLQ